MVRALLLLGLVGCAPPPAWDLIAPDAARVGQPGELGPYGAALYRVKRSARVSDLVKVGILFPTTDTGSVTDAPIMVFSPGGFVTQDRYFWMGQHLATRGWITVLPDFPNGLGIMAPGNAEIALEAAWSEAEDSASPLFGMTDSDQPIAVAGHSLGGVIASMQFVNDDQVKALIMQASFPSNGTDVEELQGNRPVLGITGTTDSVTPDEFLEKWERFEGPFASAVVDGMNHYAWTDDPKPGNLTGKDGPLERAISAVRGDAWLVMDGFLDAAVLDDDTAWDYVEANLPDTVSLEGAP